MSLYNLRLTAKLLASTSNHVTNDYFAVAVIQVSVRFSVYRVRPEEFVVLIFGLVTNHTYSTLHILWPPERGTLNCVHTVILNQFRN